MIELARVSKHYAGTLALDDISFHIRRGELALITGPSGAGKTTLLRLLYLAERPDAGTVRLAGRDVTRLRSSSLPYVRRNIGVVFQDFKLIKTRTALENVRIPLEILGLPRASVAERADHALTQVGLAGSIGVRVAKLSGGEQQRVALARALVASPALVLCDEPTGNLDAEAAGNVLEIIGAAHEQGTTVCIATHDPAVISFAQQRGARRLSLVRGRMQGGGAVVPLATRDRSRSSGE